MNRLEQELLEAEEELAQLDIADETNFFRRARVLHNVKSKCLYSATANDFKG